MLNQPLIALVNSVLGTGKPTARGNYAYSCPFCNHHKPKLEINFTENQKGENPYHCWACDKKGRKIAQVFKQKTASPEKMMELRALVKTETSDREYAVAEKVNLPKEFKTFKNITQTNISGRQALAYLKSRNITDEDILKYNIGYCETGPYKNMVVIPSYDASGSLNYFTGRSFEKVPKIKYKNPDVDPLFDFYCIGNNFRNSDIHAYIGLLDFKRVPLYTSHRKFCGDIASANNQHAFW